jgi:soluble lytic murein transglycosylase
MMVESSFKEHSLSNKGANGLMQLMPNTANEILVKSNLVANYKEPETNIKLGIQYLIHLEKKFERRDLSLIAYNRGPTRVRKELVNGNLPLGYFEKVMFYYELIS